MRRAAALLALALILTTGEAAAEPALARPAGPVVLTIGGAITRTNRPAFDAAEDSIIAHHEIAFEKAAAFDRAMLERLGMQALTVRAPGWPRAHRFEGPKLKDLLAAVGAIGETATVVGLDGFAADIPVADLETRRWIVAVRRDGEALPIGGRGPAWLLFPPAEGESATEVEEQSWPWAAFYIGIE